MGKPAARLGDTTMHGSPLLGAPCPTVLIGGKPAWRIGDQHTCPIPNAPPPACSGTPHGPGVTTPVPDGGSGLVLIGGKPAARMGDIVMEPGALIPLPPPNTIVMGCPTVLIGMPGGAGGGGGCHSEGHPVDVVSGRLIESAVDVERLTPTPFVLKRFYSSAAVIAGQLGLGWRHNLELALEESGLDLAFTDEYGSRQLLPRPPLGGSVEQGTMRVESRGERSYLLWRGPDDGLLFERGTTGAFQWTERFDGPQLAYQLTYDKSGRLSTVRDRCGKLFRFEFLGDRLLRVFECSCNDTSIARLCVEYEYDRQGWLIAVRDAAGAASEYRYDHGVLVQERDRAGFAFYFQFDAQRRCTTTWGEGGLLYRRLDYNDRDGVTRVTDSVGETRYYFHREGSVYRIAHGDGSSKSYTYNEGGQLVAFTDEVGVGLLCEYDALGRETKLVTAGGGTKEFTYDPIGRLILEKSSTGSQKQWVYDDGGRLRQVLLNGTLQCQWDYNVDGDVSRLRDGQGAEIAYTYDHFRRVTSIRDSRGGEVQLAYDDYSNICEVRDGRQLLVRCKYDEHNRLVQRTEPDGRAAQYLWNAIGLLTFVREPSGEEIQVEYRWNMRTATHRNQGTHRESTRFEYDNEQRLVGIQLSDGSAFRFIFDQRGRIVERQEPGERRVRFEHDAASRVVRERCGSHVVEFEYDGAGNLAAFRGDDDQAAHYEYDPFGTLVRAACGPHENTLEYDAAGRLIREEADGQSLVFRYAMNGSRIGIVPSIGARIEYGYFADGTLESIAAAGRSLVRYARDEQGRIIQALFANGVVEQHAWDSCSRLSHWKLAGPQETAFRQRSFSYDASSQLTSVADAERGKDRFAYTSQGWVKHQLLAGDSRGDEFRFDAQGNFLTLPRDRQAKYAAGDRLLEDGEFTYEYDELGCMAARISRQGERTTFAYDFRGLMTRLERADGRVVSYEYDAFSRRVVKRDGDVTTHYLWDGDQLLASWTSQGTVQQYVMDPYRWTSVAQLEMAEPGAPNEPLVQFCHADHLGAVTELTSSSGQVVWSVQYDALGNARQRQGTAEQTPLRRPGQYYDAETGWYYNRYRYYDPATARFTTPDPIDVDGGPNLYRYPGSAPNTLDLLGLSPMALVDNNFLVSLEHADTRGMPFSLERQMAKSNRLGVSPTAYKEFTQAPGFSKQERLRRQQLLKKYKIEPVELGCAAEQEAFYEALFRYRQQGLDQNDAAIAAHAKAKGLPLLSENVRDFGNARNARFMASSANRVASQSSVGVASRGAELFKFVFR